MSKNSFIEIQSKLKPEMLATLSRIKRFVNGNRAAVMVGSGFSKNADMPGNVQMKDWRELIDDIYAEVYGKAPSDQELMLTTPMRIASLVETNCGRAALDEIIQKSLPDELIQPGELHRKLMSLPWTDVFTTNYDTLLERAGEQTERSYYLVTNKEALLYQKRPRIIKLHGSFPDHHPFLMSEEDFRTYPERYPEMVNTVRQALIENIFCLIGFSGDDPNFLSWIGWLRDVMGKTTQPIYCITYSKTMKQPEVKLFRSRGIEFVNLYEVEGLPGFKDAFEFFFEFLGQKPKMEQWEGGPIGNKHYMDNKMGLLIGEMRKIREGYPGWLLLPSNYRTQFSDAVWGMIRCGDKMEEEALKTQVDYLYELDWRLGISLTPKETPEFITAIERVVYSGEELEEEQKERLLSLSISLLGIYRLTNNLEDFDKLRQYIKAHYGMMYSQQYKRYYYECGMMLLWQQDYQGLNELIDNWHVSLDDYEPVLWKSLLFYEAGRAHEAVQLLSLADAFISRQNLQHGLGDEYSRTCQMQIQKSLNYYRREITPLVELLKDSNNSQISFERSLCDLWEIRKTILADFHKDHDWRAHTKQHGFNIGRTTTTWRGNTGFVPNYRHPMELLLLHEQAGYPLSASVDELQQMLPSLAEFNPMVAMYASLVSSDKGTMEKTVGRQLLRRLEAVEANSLFDHLMDVYQKHRHNGYPRVARRTAEVVLPLMVRLAVRVTQNRVSSLVLEVLSINDIIRNDYLRTLYDCLEEPTIKGLLDSILSAPINGSRYELLPVLYQKDYQVRNDTIEECVAYLNDSASAVVRKNAYLRLILYYEHTGIKAHQKIIEEALRDWRMKSPNNLDKLDTFNYVSFDPEKESHNPEKWAQLKVNDFCSAGHKLENNSASVENLINQIVALRILWDFVTKADKVRIASSILDVLESNRNLLKKDDSRNLMGGIRGFTRRLLSTCEQCLVDTLPLCDERLVLRAKDLTNEYIGYGFHLMRVLVCCLQRMGDKESVCEIVNKLKDNLLDENEAAANNAVSALVMLDREQIPDSLFDTIRGYILFARRYHARTLIHFLSVMVFKDKTKEADYMRDLQILEDVADRITNYDADENQKNDIFYECFILAGLIYKKREDLREHPVMMSWKALAENEELYNDLRKGWKEGFEYGTGG